VALTVAIPVLDEVQVTVLVVALAGATVATRVVVAYNATLAETGDTVTPVTGTAATVTTLVPKKPPSVVVAVIIA